MFSISLPILFGFLSLLHFCFTSVEYDKSFDNVQFIPEHSNEWVVRIDEGDDIADLVASELGLKNERKVYRVFVVVVVLFVKKSEFIS